MSNVVSFLDFLKQRSLGPSANTDALLAITPVGGSARYFNDAQTQQDVLNEAISARLTHDAEHPPDRNFALKSLYNIHHNFSKRIQGSLESLDRDTRKLAHACFSDTVHPGMSPEWLYALMHALVLDRIIFASKPKPSTDDRPFQTPLTLQSNSIVHAIKQCLVRSGDWKGTMTAFSSEWKRDHKDYTGDVASATSAMKAIEPNIVAGEMGSRTKQPTKFCIMDGQVTQPESLTLSKSVKVDSPGSDNMEGGGDNMDAFLRDSEAIQSIIGGIKFLERRAKLNTVAQNFVYAALALRALLMRATEIPLDTKEPPIALSSYIPLNRRLKDVYEGGELPQALHNAEDYLILRPLFVMAAISPFCLISSTSFAVNSGCQVPLYGLGQAVTQNPFSSSSDKDDIRQCLEYEIINLVVDMALQGCEIFENRMNRIVESWDNLNSVSYPGDATHLALPESSPQTHTKARAAYATRSRMKTSPPSNNRPDSSNTQSASSADKEAPDNDSVEASLSQSISICSIEEGHHDNIWYQALRQIEDRNDEVIRVVRYLQSAVREQPKNKAPKSAFDLSSKEPAWFREALSTRVEPGLLIQAHTHRRTKRKRKPEDHSWYPKHVQKKGKIEIAGSWQNSEDEVSAGTSKDVDESLIVADGVVPLDSLQPHQNPHTNITNFLHLPAETPGSPRLNLSRLVDEASSEEVKGLKISAYVLPSAWDRRPPQPKKTLYIKHCHTVLARETPIQDDLLERSSILKKDTPHKLIDAKGSETTPRPRFASLDRDDNSEESEEFNFEDLPQDRLEEGLTPWCWTCTLPAWKSHDELEHILEYVDCGEEDCKGTFASSNPYETAFVLSRSLWEDKGLEKRRDLMCQANILVKGDDSLASTPGGFTGWNEVLKLSDYVQLQEPRVAHDYTSVPRAKMRTALQGGDQPYFIDPLQNAVQTSLEDLFNRQKEMRMKQTAFFAAEFPRTKQSRKKNAIVNLAEKPQVYCLNVLNIPITSDLVNLEHFDDTSVLVPRKTFGSGDKPYTFQTQSEPTSLGRRWMSASLMASWTKWHMDVSGLTTYFHVWDGTMVVLIPQNGDISHDCGHSGTHDNAQKLNCDSIILEPSDELYIRAGTGYMTIAVSDSLVLGGQFYFFGSLESTLRAIILGHYQDIAEDILSTQYIKAPVQLLKAICQVSEDQLRIVKLYSNANGFTKLWRKRKVSDGLLSKDESLKVRYCDKDLSYLVVVVAILDQTVLAPKYAGIAYDQRWASEFKADCRFAQNAAVLVAERLCERSIEFAQLLKTAIKELMDLCRKQEAKLSASGKATNPIQLDDPEGTCCLARLRALVDGQREIYIQSNEQRS